MIRKLFLLAITACFATSYAHAQARATASRNVDIQVGGGFNYVFSDYSPQKYKGWAIYADYDFLPHWGFEFDLHQSDNPTPVDTYERTYEFGGRYKRNYGRYTPYGKVMYGRGVFRFPFNRANLAYNLVSFGGGVDVKVLPHVNARADYTYQKWFSFPDGDPAYNGSGGGLSPSLITIGAAYHF